MKATGIVRRIDELGRVVIPKEIRKTLRIKEGDPLEIYTDKEEVLFRKYSPIASIETSAGALCEAVREVTDKTVLLFDCDSVIAAAGKDVKNLVGEPVSEELERILTERTMKVANLSEGDVIVPLFRRDILTLSSEVVVPVVSNGDLLGGVAIISKEDGSFGEVELLIAKCTAAFLARQFE